MGLYYTVNPDSSHITDIINFFKKNSSIGIPRRAIVKELILDIALSDGAIFSRIAQYTKQYGSARALLWHHKEIDFMGRAILKGFFFKSLVVVFLMQSIVHRTPCTINTTGASPISVL